MKRILLLVTVASMLAAAMALSGVAQAAPISGKADARCAKEAIKTLGPSFNPSNYTFHGGTEGIDDSAYFNAQATAGPDVFCGFGGDDSIFQVAEGDIFLGGAGNDAVSQNNGTFYGQEGIDVVGDNFGTFYGQEGDDRVTFNNGTFFGGAGNDAVFNNGQPSLGPPGTFYGQEGNDRVSANYAGSTFDGGDGTDTVSSVNIPGGILINVEVLPD